MSESFDISPDEIQIKGTPKGIRRISRKAKIMLGVFLFAIVVIIVISSNETMNIHQERTPEEDAAQRAKEEEGKPREVTTSNFLKEGVPDAQSSTIPIDQSPVTTPMPGPTPGTPISLENAKGANSVPPIKGSGNLDSKPLSEQPDMKPMSGGGPGDYQSPEQRREEEKKRRLEQYQEQAAGSGLDAPGDWGRSSIKATVSQGQGMFGTEGGAVSGPPKTNVSGQQVQDDQNKQVRKENFIREAATQRDEIFLREPMQPQISNYQINMGWKIPAGLECGLNSDLPGTVCALVRENVCDSKTGKYLLIPQGTKAHGTYDSQVAVGQERILLVWNYLEFPDGSVQPLRGMLGADQSGYAGFDADVDNHYWKLFGTTGMMSLFSAGFQLSQPQASQGSNGVPSTSQTIAATVGQQIGQTASGLMQKQINVQPTLKRSAGYRFNIMVTRNMVLPKDYGKCY